MEEYTMYPTVQSLGIVVLLGYFLLHLEIEKWKLWNELPVLVGSGLLTVTPLLLS